MRMVFLVGLEGSGHHFMNHVLSEVCAFDTVRCPNMCPMAEVLFNEVGTPNTPKEYWDGLEKFRDMMGALDLTINESTEERAVSVATFQDCGRNYHVGQMSFPNYGGEDKALQYVDLRVLAAEAERANIDLRIIFLSRSAKEILISTTEHRRFGSFVHEGRVLMNSAAVIESSFQELTSGFTTCFAFGRMFDLTQADRVAEFVMPTAQTARYFAQGVVDVAKQMPSSESSNATDGATAKDLMTNRLQKKLDMIERCHC